MVKVKQEKPIFKNEKLEVEPQILWRNWKKAPRRISGYEITIKETSEKKFFWKKDKAEFVSELEKYLNEEKIQEVLSKIDVVEKGTR